MPKKPIEIDLTPILEFRYVQISNYNFQYLLLKDNKALHTPFECKDYLQDIFWSEYTNNRAAVWGITWRPGTLDMSVETFDLAMMGDEEQNLSARIPHLKEILNEFDKALGFKLTKVLPTTDSKYIVIRFSKEWTESPLLLSAYTTLIRIAGDYNLGEGAMSYLKRIMNEPHPEKFINYMQKDVKRGDTFVQKYNVLLHGKKPEFSWADLKNTNQAHDHGLVAAKEFSGISLE